MLNKLCKYYSRLYIVIDRSKKYDPHWDPKARNTKMAPKRNEVVTEPFETKIKLQQDLGMKAILNSEGSFGKASSMMLRKITPT